MALEVIGGTAAVSQLLGQAIVIVQKIHKARVQVQGAADNIDRHKDQLDSLLQTLRLVQGEKELQTPAIEEQVQAVIDIGEDLQTRLDTLAVLSRRSTVKQYAHSLKSGDRDEKQLGETWARLDRAKADLDTRILAANVGLSGSMREGFEAALAIVQRVDRNVKRVLGKRLLVATQLEGRNPGENGNGTVPLTDEDANTLNLVDNVSWIENRAFDDAVVVGGDLVERPIHSSKVRNYNRNEARNKSVLVLGNVDAGGLADIIRARNGQ